MSRVLPKKLQIIHIKRWMRKNGYFEDDIGDIGALFDSLDSTLCFCENFTAIKEILGGMNIPINQLFGETDNQITKEHYAEYFRSIKDEQIKTQHDLECDAIEYINELAFQILDEQAEQADMDLVEIQDFLDIKMLNGGILIRLNVRLRTFIKKSGAYFQSWLSFIISRTYAIAFSRCHSA